MAFGQVAGLSDPLEDYPGYFLKFFEQGTTAPLVMATDSTGGTTLAKAEISSGGTVPIGFIKTAGDAIFIPWVDGFYDAFLIPTEAEADANILTNAVQIADNLNADPASSTNFTADSKNVNYVVANNFANGVDRTQEDKNADTFTLKDEGAVGDGVTDDTTEIDNAWLISKATIANSLSGEVAGELNTTLTIPPGDYVYSGTGLTIVNGNVSFKADPNTVRIRLPDGIYFIEATGAISNSNVVGINTYGGLGAVKYSFTGNNVTGKHKVTDCMFSDYTQCAIGNNSNDFPHMRIERNIFRCREGEDAFGIAWGGFLDGLVIRNNDFRKNKIHIKVGDRLSGNNYIEENDFINTGSQDRLADIWFVPNSTDAGGLASGQGTIVAKNKFGNESMAVDDARILVATEAAGTDRLSRQPNLVWDTSAFITDIKIKDNTFNGVGNQTGPLIKSYVQHARGWIFKGNEMQGGDHTFLVDWAGALNDDEHSSMWDIDLALGSNPHVRIMPISNQPMGLVRDPFVQSGGDVATVQSFPTIGDDVSFTELLALQDPVTDGSMVNGARVAVNDGLGLGGQKAIEVDASTATGRWTSAAITDPTAGLPSFVEVDIKKASTNPVDEVEISIKHSVTNLFIVRRVVKMPDDWLRLIIPFTPQTNAGAANSYQLAVTVRGYVEATTDRFEVGRMAVYQSRQAMNYGHLRTLGTGAWDEEHIIMGNFHQFMNGNDLRLSIGAPTSATDGTLLGTAT